MKRENIVILVLTSGEHVIGEQVGETEDGGIILENPVSMMPDPTPGATGRILFIPYLQFTDLTSAPFPSHNIRHALTDVKEDLRNNYAQQYGDGLQVPKKEILLT